MKYALLTFALLASCSTRRLPATPSYMVIPVKAASCEVVPHNDLQGFQRVEVRYTVEDAKSMDVRRIEFRKAK